MRCINASLTHYGVSKILLLPSSLELITDKVILIGVTAIQVVVVGSSERLGNWQADCGLAMQWNEGDDWTVDLDLPIE